MTAHTLVCPLERSLLTRLRGRRVVLRVATLAEVPAAVAAGREHDLDLEKVVVVSAGSLGSLPSASELQGVPIEVHARRLGPVLEVLRHIGSLRELGVQVFLPSGQSDSYRMLRILASLGVRCGVELQPSRVDWEQLADLMVWSLLGLAESAPMSPFFELARDYSPRDRADLGAVYLDDPTRYLHLDAEGRVGLSADELEAGRVVADDLRSLDDVPGLPAYLERIEAWRQVFLDLNGCASCPAWRVCLARFSGDAASGAEANPGCRAFFMELIEVAEQRQDLDRKRRRRWRPRS